MAGSTEYSSLTPEQFNTAFSYFLDEMDLVKRPGNSISPVDIYHRLIALSKENVWGENTIDLDHTIAWGEDLLNSKILWDGNERREVERGALSPATKIAALSMVCEDALTGRKYRDDERKAQIEAALGVLYLYDTEWKVEEDLYEIYGPKLNDQLNEMLRDDDLRPLALSIQERFQDIVDEAEREDSDLEYAPDALVPEEFEEELTKPEANEPISEPIETTTNLLTVPNLTPEQHADVNRFIARERQTFTLVLLRYLVDNKPTGMGKIMEDLGPTYRRMGGSGEIYGAITAGFQTLRHRLPRIGLSIVTIPVLNTKALLYTVSGEVIEKPSQKKK